MRVDGQLPPPSPVLTRERRGVVEGAKQALDQPLRGRQIRFDGLTRGLVTEGKEPRHDGEQGRRRRGHQEQEVEQIVHGNGLAKWLEVEDVLEHVARLSVNNRRGDRRMRVTHSSLQFRLI